MNNRMRKISVVLLLGVLLLNGCGNNDHNGSSEKEVDKVPYEVSQEENSAEQSNNDENEDEHAHESVSMDVNYYTVSNDGMDYMVKDVVASVQDDTDITPEFVMQLVIEGLSDNGFVVEYNSATIYGDNVVIDLNGATPPVVGVDEKVEKVMLEAIAFSMLDNIKDCNGVIFHVDGKAYISDNTSYGYDEAFTTR